MGWTGLAWLRLPSQLGKVKATASVRVQPLQGTKRTWNPLGLARPLFPLGINRLKNLF